MSASQDLLLTADEKEFILHIKAVDKSPLEIPAHTSDTIEIIKQKYCDLTETPIESQIYVYRTSKMNNTDTLSKYKINTDTTIHAVIKKTQQQILREIQTTNEDSNNAYNEDDSNEEEEIQISIKKLDGDAFYINILPTSSVLDLKNIINNQQNISADLRLIYGDQELKHDFTLSQYGIQNGSTLHLEQEYNKDSDEKYNQDVSDLATYQSAVYGNETLKLHEIKQQKYKELIIDNGETKMNPQNDNDSEPFEDNDEKKLTNVEMTLDEFKNQNPIKVNASNDFINKYAEQQEAVLQKRMETIDIRQLLTENNTDYGEKWIKETTQLCQLVMGGDGRMAKIELNAYIQPTIYEQQQAVKLFEKQKKMIEEIAYKMTKAKSNDNEKASKHSNEQMEVDRESSEFYQVCAEMKPPPVQEVVKIDSRGDIWKEFMDAVENHPMVISNKYNVEEYQSMLEHKIDETAVNMYGAYPDEYDHQMSLQNREDKNLWIKLTDLFDECLTQRKILMHKFFVYILGCNSWRFDDIYEIKDKNKNRSNENSDNNISPWRHGFSDMFEEEKSYGDIMNERIKDEVCKTFNKIGNGGTISNHEKHFVKFLLCWPNEKYYIEYLTTAKRIMNILRKPLINEYNNLQKRKSKLLILKLDPKDRLPKHIISNHGLLEWDYLKWYKYRKAFFYPNDIKQLCEQWIKLGLNIVDTNFTDLRHKDFTGIEFTSSDELAIEYLNLIAAKLDPSFQKRMNNLFDENRKLLNLNLKYKTMNNDLGVLSGPIKTKARQKVKIELDYCDKQTPQVMNILDISRCAIVCENDIELCSLFQLITTKFSGKILRVKNAFDDVKKGSYGYRAVLINIAYGDKTLLPKGFEMICECQLLLLGYYQVRKKMHLGYGIVRSEDTALNYEKQPYEVLAKDSCKFGKLDI